MGAKAIVCEKILAMPVIQTQINGFLYFFIVIVHILYCGGCDFKGMYEHASQVILTVFPNAIIQGEAHDGHSGVFNVTINNKDASVTKVYSRKYGGFFSSGDGSFGDERSQCSLIEKIKKIDE